MYISNIILASILFLNSIVSKIKICAHKNKLFIRQTLIYLTLIIQLAQ